LAARASSGALAAGAGADGVRDPQRGRRSGPRRKRRSSRGRPARARRAALGARGMRSALPRRAVLASLLASMTLAGPTALAQEPGRVALLITYKCPPADRPVLREHLEGPGGARLAEWQREGKFTDS